MNKHLHLIILIIALFLSGCGILPANNSGSLSGTAWTLVSYDGKTLLSGTAMTAVFENGEVNGSSSCNLYFGDYKIRGDQIQIEGLGWTEMACLDPEGLMQQEQQLMSLFSQARTFSIQGDVLQILSSSGESLIFQKMEPKSD